MGSVSVSSCRCCMFVSCVHPVAVLNAAFCMTCSLLIAGRLLHPRPAIGARFTYICLPSNKEIDLSLYLTFPQPNCSVC